MFDFEFSFRGCTATVGEWRGAGAGAGRLPGKGGDFGLTEAAGPGDMAWRRRQAGRGIFDAGFPGLDGGVNEES